MLTTCEIAVPNFGTAGKIPSIPAPVYEARVQKLMERMRDIGLDAVLVYADREHSANMAYCTGFDPRFEEALFILTAEGQSTICAGNECLGALSDLPISAEVMLCQEFSLMGQDRSVSWDLAPLLAKAGLRAGMRCGIAGWKTLMANRIEVPAYIVDLVTDACASRPVNANDIFMHPSAGLRIINEPAQIALNEYAATRTSGSVLDLLRSLEEGKSCVDMARAFDGGGLPLSCHPMLSCGETIRNALSSPGNETVRKGDYLFTAFGVWGSLTCRAGVLTDDRSYFETDKGRTVWRVIENYLHVVRAWYAALDVGVPAGEVWAAAEQARNESLYAFCVNPGHYIHTDEWLCSPFQKGSTDALPSGSAIQADIIPVPHTGGISVNMEDGVVLADKQLRDELQCQYPGMFARCQARRQFMIDALGYELSEAVLPMGNMPGAYFPCLLNTALICRHE